MAIAERVEALSERQVELVAQIDRVAKQKAQALQKQLRTIQAGTCPPAPVQNPDKDPEPDPNVFILCADAVISFKIGEEDFLEKIPDFGSITEASTYASRSYARGPALGALKVGNPSFLWVFACDKDGARRAEGGDDVVATVSNPEHFEKVEIEDRKDGVYKVTLVPCNTGTYDLSLTVGPPGLEHEDVQDSPFVVQVRPPTEFHQLGGVAEDREAKPRIGEQLDPSGKFGTMGHPSGLEFDHTGRYLFVADQSNHRVQVFDTEDGHAPVAAFGKKGLGSSNFDSPCAIVVDRENRVIVSDLLNHRLQIFEFIPRARSLRQVRVLENSFQFPKGLGLTENGHLLVCDSGNHRVQEFNILEDFRLVRHIGSHGTSEGQFTTPLDVAVNRNGEILVSDATNRISVFDKEGQFLRFLGSKGRKDGCFNYPVSIAVNDEDALFVCDQGNQRVQVLRASDGAFIHKWGGPKKKKGEGEEEPPPADDEEVVEKAPEQPEMTKPSGIAINSNGLVVVADYATNLLWTF